LGTEKTKTENLDTKVSSVETELNILKNNGISKADLDAVINE